MTTKIYQWLHSNSILCGAGRTIYTQWDCLNFFALYAAFWKKRMRKSETIHLQLCKSTKKYSTYCILTPRLTAVNEDRFRFIRLLERKALWVFERSEKFTYTMWTRYSYHNGVSKSPSSISSKNWREHKGPGGKNFLFLGSLSLPKDSFLRSRALERIVVWVLEQSDRKRSIQ